MPTVIAYVLIASAMLSDRAIVENKVVDGKWIRDAAKLALDAGKNEKEREKGEV